jgi:hypothetical protein
LYCVFFGALHFYIFRKSAAALKIVIVFFAFGLLMVALYFILFILGQFMALFWICFLLLYNFFLICILVYYFSLRPSKKLVIESCVLSALCAASIYLLRGIGWYEFGLQYLCSVWVLNITLVVLNNLSPDSDTETEEVQG